MPLTDPQTFHCSRARDHSHFYIRFQTLNAPFNLSVEWLPVAAYPFHNIRAEGLPLWAAPGTGFVASYPPINNALNPYSCYSCAYSCACDSACRRCCVSTIAGSVGHDGSAAGDSSHDRDRRRDDANAGNVMTQRIAEPGYSISSRCCPSHDSTMAAYNPVNCAILIFTIASCQQPSTRQPTTLRLPPCHLLDQEPACRQRQLPTTSACY